jgi:hypothetical protein
LLISRRAEVIETTTWPSWLLGSTVEAFHFTVQLSSADHLDLDRLIDFQLRQVARRYLTDEFELAPRDDAEKSLALGRCKRSDHGGRGADQSCDRRLNLERSAFRWRQACEDLARGDVLAGIDHDLCDLEARTIGTDRDFLARDQDAGDFDGRGEAGLRGGQHGHCCTLRGISRIVGGQGRLREHA